MRRWAGVVVISALVAVLCPRIAFASLQPLQNDGTDFGTQLFTRVFFEAPAAAARFSLADGDRLSESFFRRYALRVGALPIGSGTALIDVSHLVLPLLPLHLFETPAVGSVAAVRASAYRAPAYHAPEVATPQQQAATAVAEATPFVQLYQDASPQPTIEPASFHFEMTSPTDTSSSRLLTLNPLMNPQEAYTTGASGPDPVTTLPQQQAAFSVPVRVGHVHVQPHFEGAQANVPSMSLRDSAVNTGATIDTRVGSQKINLDLSSGYEHMQIDPQVNATSFDMSSNWQVGNGGVPLLAPAYADVSKRTLAAGVGVPVAQNVTLNVQAATEHLQGGYGAPGLTNLDATNNVYGGRVTFQLPHSTSSISLSAKQYRFQDNLTPNTYTQTNANLNFTVKF